MENDGSSCALWVAFRQRPDLGLDGGQGPWTAWTGYSAAHVPGPCSSAEFLQRIVEEDRPQFLDHVQKSAASSQWVFAKFRVHSGDQGELRTVAEWRRCLPAKKTAEGFEVLWFDLSSPELLRNHLVQSHEKRAMVELTRGLMHDLNNALAGVSSLADLSLMDMDRRHPHRKNLRNILEGTRKAAGLIDRFGRLLQGKSGEQGYHDARTLAQEAVVFLRPTIPRRIELKCQTPEDPLPVFLDGRALRLVLFSLALDAAATLKEKGRIELRASLSPPPPPAALMAGTLPPKRNAVALTVADTGPGFDRAQRQSILRMEPGPHSDHYGFGVGLTHALDFINQGQGALSVQAPPVQNAAVTLWLPQAEC